MKISLGKHHFTFFSILVFLSFHIPVSVAQSSDEKTSKKPINLIFDDNEGSELQLEIRQMPMADALDSIAKQTGVPIHYSVLPEGLVTATCVGNSLKTVLDCLLNKKADLIVRYPRNTDKDSSRTKVAEAWILGSRLDGIAAKADCSTNLGGINGSLTMSEHKQHDAESERIQQLLKMATSEKPEQRAEAIGSLLATDRKNDPEIKALLENSLHDKDANVRAQAISTLSHLEGNDAMPAIQEALQDSSADVRMMAVDGITDDVTLLQQAINDSDETVRSLATLKLEELMKENQTKP